VPRVCPQTSGHVAALVRTRRDVRRTGIAATVTNSSVSVFPIAVCLAGVPALVSTRTPSLHGSAWPYARCTGALADTVIAISEADARRFGGRRARVVRIAAGSALPPACARRRAPCTALPVLAVVSAVDRNRAQDLAVAAPASLRRAGSTRSSSSRRASLTASEGAPQSGPSGRASAPDALWRRRRVRTSRSPTSCSQSSTASGPVPPGCSPTSTRRSASAVLEPYPSPRDAKGLGVRRLEAFLYRHAYSGRREPR
jgi:hypothetical protein